ncbi:MAG: hypothetical protein QME51_09790 [Planctomycetota bacterium]|nr:hypothetical protein [Planctomycetota bacterium]MDI6788650.1 hypothetical protein [Planctomycetota bacterium]
MGIARKIERNIIFPRSIFETAETKEDLEDWLLSQNPDFIKRMRQARQDDLDGKGISWTKLKRRLCTK